MSENTVNVPGFHTICPTCTGRGSIPFAYAAVPEGCDDFVLAKVAHNIPGYVPVQPSEIGGGRTRFHNWSEAKTLADEMNKAMGIPNAMAIFIVAQSMKDDAAYRFPEAVV